MPPKNQPPKKPPTKKAQPPELPRPDEQHTTALGRCLRELREARQLTHAEMALRTGRSQSTFSAIERGLSQPYASTIKSILRTLSDARPLSGVEIARFAEASGTRLEEVMATLEADPVSAERAHRIHRLIDQLIALGGAARLEHTLEGIRHAWASESRGGPDRG